VRDKLVAAQLNPFVIPGVESRRAASRRLIGKVFPVKFRSSAKKGGIA
jgi:hypothetical protein